MRMLFCLVLVTTLLNVGCEKPKDTKTEAPAATPTTGDTPATSDNPSATEAND